MDHQDRFSKLGFEDFRKLASDPNISNCEKIGFPDSYREGKELNIFEDVTEKLFRLKSESKLKVLDIGPGCSEFPKLLIQLCEQQEHELFLIDSQEMLSLLPESKTTTKISAQFPACTDFIQNYLGRIDVILCYSVFQYVFSEGNLFAFLDQSLSLLAPGGLFLIGDIPNNSKRKRFFSSASGVEFHRNFMNTTNPPEVTFNTLEPEKIDDSVIMAVLSRARTQGYDSYILPQNKILPMANRREDILICRP
ncbi:MAG: class I SAM-dependent methyltransferase [Proteobacteria bacterium]|nr:class I SAM-dependent methyltransferase [Pseudomonadota bacterium]